MVLSVKLSRELNYPNYYGNQKMCRSLIALGCESQKESLASRSMGEYRQDKPLPFFYSFHFKNLNK
jgi:hypothetical protein